jgi:hypothetical protein
LIRTRAITVLFAALVPCACTFPDVTIAMDADVPVDGHPPERDGSLEADGVASDTRVGDAPADPCDMDRDGYKAEGIACGGNDCDDHDSRANPGVMTFLTYKPTTTNPVPGDWNCDGKVETEWTTDFSCVALGASCASQQGFSDDPSCGDTGTLLQCQAGSLPLTCQTGSQTSTLQGCM